MHSLDEYRIDRSEPLFVQEVHPQFCPPVGSRFYVSGIARLIYAASLHYFYSVSPELVPTQPILMKN